MYRSDLALSEATLFPNLFGAPALPGLRHAEDLVLPGEERALIAAIDALDLSPFRFQGWLGKRLTTSFGWRYDFDDASFTRGAPLPDWLLPLRDKAADFAGLPAAEFAHALLIRYDPGAGIGWHKDRPVFEHVLGVSLGNAATMRFRKRRPGGFDRFAAPLAPRSVYHLSGEARHQWEHSIAPMEAPRWSITFRSLSDKGRALSSAS
ncbi:alpha-ketoglutarate-dependent dioxygenase AlkB [Sphingomonas psychrotolerans]|uniref:Alpha-ketoglutarate-dependent dioxygenase AlkB n=1 Tax=Sphingomonas psychrotolerans TaxID=1327635 RepID=A0ABU3N2B7_9SPHN|nr:alpha-ketoglutarate-dependent dioxygenase AlkB [Sphingomonas psychrotolerans]MDT8758543.1 alpha-ketoglutarate-dependent dioxygenase AlkB [Sphingomonas psychrotolerans]